MLRSIGAVLIGYLAVSGFVMLTMTLAWKLLGPGFAFEGHTTGVTWQWAVLSLVLGALGALLGGLVTRYLRPLSAKPVRALAAILLVFGLSMGILHAIIDEPGIYSDTDLMSSYDAASEAIQPTWYNFTLPFVGALGVLVGGRSRKSRESTVA